MERARSPASNRHVDGKHPLSPSDDGILQEVVGRPQNASTSAFVHDSFTSAKVGKKFSALVHPYLATKGMLGYIPQMSPDTPSIHMLVPLAVSILLFGLMLIFEGKASLGSYSEKAQQSFHLFSCFVGLVTVFGVYGVLQEYIMTTNYAGDRFPSAMFLIIVNRVVAIIAAVFAMAFRPTEETSWVAGAWCSASVPALTVLLGSWCQHNSLLYITFPSQTVFKSSKIIPTMVLSTVVNSQKYTWREYVVAAVVTMSVTGFFLCTDQENESSPEHNTTVGILMMVIFLICDSVTSTAEKHVNDKFPNLGNAQMMLSMSLLTLFFAIFAMLFGDGFHPTLVFLRRHPEALVQILGFGCSSTVGQYLVLHTIRTFGPVSYVVMMTVRQIISIVMSASLYKHTISWQAYVFAGIAFLAILMKPPGRCAGRT